MPGGGWTWATNSNWADPPPPRQWTNGTYGGVKGVTAVDTWGLSGRAGALTVQRPIFSPLTAVGAALARCFGNAICAAGTMIAVPLALERLRVGQGSGGGVTHDPGVNPETFTGNAWYAPQDSRPHPSAAAACEARFETYNSQQSASGGNILQSGQMVNERDYFIDGYGWSRVADCYAVEIYGSSAGTGYTGNVASPYGYRFGVEMRHNVQQSRCPASVDPLDPAYSIPAGEPVDSDGKCKTARYHHTPIDPAAVGELLDANNPTSQQDIDRMLDAIREALQRGEQIPGSESLPMTGPGSQTGTPSTTTTTLPGGGTRTETRTPTYTYNYGDTTITYNTTYTTIINDNGQVTTIEEGGSPSEQSDFCVDNPNVLACQEAELDEPQVDVPRETRSVTYEAENLWGGGSCPADATQVIGGQTLTIIPWSEWCGRINSWVRPVLLLCAAFTAFLIISPGAGAGRLE
jgi:hypothetical protein